MHTTTTVSKKGGNTVIALFLSFILSSGSAFAKVELLADFDGTLNRDRGTQAAWITPWLLKRVEHLHSVFQQSPNQGMQVQLSDPEQISYYNSVHGTDFPVTEPVRVTLNLPATISVSYDEFRKIEGKIAHDEKTAGNLHPVLLSFDPMYPDRNLLIVPGYYRIFDLTFKYYREATGAKKRNYILSDLHQAIERAKMLGDGYSWMGPVMPFYVALKSSQETVNNVSIFTSRGNPLEDFWAFDDELVKMGVIKYAADAEGKRPMVFTFGRPESRMYGASLKEKKLDVAYNKAMNINRSAGKKHWEVDENGNWEKTNTLIIAEDEPAYFEPIAEMLLNASSSVNGGQAKLVLFNCGSDEEVKSARFPYRFTVFMKGRRTRAATEAEIEGWLNPNSGKGCPDFLEPQAPPQPKPEEPS